MGQQKRYAAEPTAELRRAGLAMEQSLSTAVDRIRRHREATDDAQIYAGDGQVLVGDVAGIPVVEAAYWLPGCPELRYRPTTRVDGLDGALWVPAESDRAFVWEVVWACRQFETTARRWHRWVADALYAAIGSGRLPPAPAGYVDALAGRIMTQTADRRQIQVAHAAGVRRSLGLPAGSWGDAEWQLAARGRQLAATCGEI